MKDEPATSRTAPTNELRHTAANLRILASIYAANSERTGILAWTIAELRLLDAIDALETEADARDGVWELPFRKLVPSRPFGSGHVVRERADV